MRDKKTPGKILRPTTDGSYPISIGSMTGRPSQLEACRKLPKTTDVIRCFVTKFMACQVSGCKRPQIDMCGSMSSGVHNYFLMFNVYMFWLVLTRAIKQTATKHTCDYFSNVCDYLFFLIFTITRFLPTTFIKRQILKGGMSPMAMLALV
jgi:hypothetical protein